MAETQHLLHLQEDGEDSDHHPEHIIALESQPNWGPHDFGNFGVYVSSHPPIAVHALDLFQTQPQNSFQIQGVGNISELDSIGTINLCGHEDVNLSMDLIHHVEHSEVMVEDDFVSETLDDSGFGVVGGNGEMDSNYLNLDLGLGLGLGFDFDAEANCSGGENCDLFVDRKVSVSESGDSSMVSGAELFGNGEQLVGFESNYSEDEGEVEGIDFQVGDEFELDQTYDGNGSIRVHWDSLQLDDYMETDEDAEWEEVNDVINETEGWSMVLGSEEEEPIPSFPEGETLEMFMRRGGTVVNLDWQVVLDVLNAGRTVEMEHDSEASWITLHDYVHTAQFQRSFGQFAENGDARVVRPPASKSAVENLPVVVLTQGDVESNNAHCVVCKDEINVGEQTKQLPCTHRYHGDCIVQWLGIRNTCPLCRYELPTDDPLYERRRT